MSDFDLVIKNGTLYDGTGFPGRVADVAVKDGKIALVDDHIPADNAERVIDAEGLNVAPGFVDLHTHYDAQIFWDPHCTLSGWHGVTSVVIGNCGFGLAPCQPSDRERLMLSLTRNEQISLEAMQEGLPWDWETFGEFLDSVDRAPKGVNVASFAPLTPIMVWAMGGYDEAKSRRPTEGDLNAIKREIGAAMDAGAIGWSTQRLGQNSVQPDYDGTPMITDVMTDEEGFALAEYLKERGEGRIQLTYIANEGPKTENFFREGMDKVMNWETKLAEISSRPVIHNTVQSAKADPDFHRIQLNWLEDCNRKGVPVYGQGETNRQFAQFNFIDWNGADSLPFWNKAFTGTREQKLANIRNPELKAKMLEESKALEAFAVFGSDWHKFRVLSVPDRCAHLQDLVGRTLGEIAGETGKSVFETALDIASETELEVEMVAPPVRDQDPAHIAEMIRSGLICPGVSDGGAHMKMFVGGAFTTDFMCWMVRETGALKPEEAHRALSYLPAQMVGLKNRGMIVEGYQADIIVYDMDELGTDPDYLYETVHDLPGGDWRRIKRAKGYRHIIVNGEETMADGQDTGARPGRLLRHGRG